MLKLRSPIKTVLKSGFVKTTEAFSERILGNYTQIGAELSEADLLHVTTQPPEIFVMGGQGGGIFTSVDTENVQINKVNIINNLINRILLSVDGNMSYQDRVYITNVLHKLGVRDEKTFMSNVYRMTEETKALNETINLYWENLDELRYMVETYIENEEHSSRTENEILTQQVLHLHETVNRRLNTAAIYRILQNFSHSTGDTNLVTGAEYNLTEQTRISKEILLNRLRESVREEALPLTFRHENYYEGDPSFLTEVSVKEITERINSAVLLNLIDLIYENVYDRIEQHADNWFSTEETYYGAANNTLYRISEHTAYLQYLYEKDIKNDTVIENYRAETELIRNLLNIYRSEDLRLQQSVAGNRYENDLFYQNIEGDETRIEMRSELQPAEMTFLTEEGDVTVDGSQVTEKKEISEELYQTYQQNIARNERYMQNLRNIIEQNTPKADTQDPVERTFRDGLEALTHPEAFRQAFLEREEEAAERIETIREQSERLLPPGQQMIYRLIREYLRAPERFYQSERISTNNLGLLLRDIKEAEYEADNPVKEEQESSPEGEKTIPILRETLPAVYPPSSDTTVPSVYPAVSPAALTELKNRYVSYQLANIYPTAIDELIYADRDVTVEEVSRILRERIPEGGGGKEESGSGNGDVAQSLRRERETRSFQTFLSDSFQTTESEMVLYRDARIVDHITEHVIERWMNERMPAPEPVTVDEREQITMVHRSTEVAVNEEVIEQMQQELIRLDQTNRTIQENVEHRQIENRTVVNHLREETVEQNEEAIRSIVKKSVNQQLDELSDKVYGRIERQLRNEQRRRGL